MSEEQLFRDIIDELRCENAALTIKLAAARLALTACADVREARVAEQAEDTERALWAKAYDKGWADAKAES